jgi:hypothetical protein
MARGEREREREREREIYIYSDDRKQSEKQREINMRALFVTLHPRSDQTSQQKQNNTIAVFVVVVVPAAPACHNAHIPSHPISYHAIPYRVLKTPCDDVPVGYCF